MKKIFLFFIVLMGLGGYWLKKTNLLTDIQKSTDEVKADGMFSNKEEASPIPYKFSVGECVSLDKGSWDHYKIRDLREDHYIVSECRKFKGCKADTQSMYYKDFDGNYKIAWVLKCAEKS